MDIKEKAGEIKEKVEEAFKDGKVEEFFKEDIPEAAAGLKEKVQGLLDKTDIDDKIVEKVQDVKEKIVEKFKKEDTEE